MLTFNTLFWYKTVGRHKMPGKRDRTCSPIRTTGGQVDGEWEPRPLWVGIAIVYATVYISYLNAEQTRKQAQIVAFMPI